MVKPRTRCFACFAAIAACASQPLPAAEPSSAGPSSSVAAAPKVAWTETFQKPLDWVTPLSRAAPHIHRVYQVASDASGRFLRARHDAAPTADGSPPPAVHFGKSFRDHPVPLDRVAYLRWRWRVHAHPKITADAWDDLAASVYVVVKTPGILPGRGMKFGWLAAAGSTGDRQRGIVQIPLRTGGPIGQWQTEQQDLCKIYRQYYGACEGEHVLYVGVVTDADNTQSVAAGDYADFELVMKP